MWDCFAFWRRAFIETGGGDMPNTTMKIAKNLKHYKRKGGLTFIYFKNDY